MNKSYQDFVTKYYKLPWENNESKNYEGMHTFEIAYKRFKYIYDYLVNLKKKKKIKISRCRLFSRSPLFYDKIYF